MRLSISNIAWDPAEDAEIAALLRRYAVDAIDVAPSKYFSDVGAVSDAQINRVKRFWQDEGIEIVGMQSLLYGTSGLNLFGPMPVREAMLKHLAGVCHIAQGLGARHLVFGSPRNRDRLDLSDEAARIIAVDFFCALGDVAAHHGVQICLEPNPPRYGANFMIEIADTAEVVEAVSHPAILMQLDTGGLTIAGEDIWATMTRYGRLIGHVHASEPDLLPLGDGETEHQLIAEALRVHRPESVVCIEMLATREEPHLQSIERSLCTVIAAYGAFEGVRA